MQLLHDVRKKVNTRFEYLYKIFSTIFNISRVGRGKKNLKYLLRISLPYLNKRYLKW